MAKHSRDFDTPEQTGLYAEKGMNEVIAFKNHIGIIAPDNGTIIKMSPKIHSAISDGNFR